MTPVPSERTVISYWNIWSCSSTAKSRESCCFPELLHVYRQETPNISVQQGGGTVVSGATFSRRLSLGSNRCWARLQWCNATASGKKMAAWCPVGEYSVCFNAPLESLCLDKCPFFRPHEGWRWVSRCGRKPSVAWQPVWRCITVIPTDHSLSLFNLKPFQRFRTESVFQDCLLTCNKFYSHVFVRSSWGSTLCDSCDIDLVLRIKTFLCNRVHLLHRGRVFRTWRKKQPHNLPCLKNCVRCAGDS